MKNYNSEAQLVKHIKTRLFKLGRNIMFQKIESGGTSLGIPDVYYRTYKGGGWIEFKTGLWPKKLSTTIEPKYRPGQLKWLNHNSRLNGKSFLIIQFDEEIFVFKGNNIRKEYTQEMFIRHASYKFNWSDVFEYTLYNLLNGEPI